MFMRWLGRSQWVTSPIGSGLVLAIVCGSLFFWQLDAYTLFNETEAKQAEIARQILVRQDWLTPYYNDAVYFDKPILLHWLMAIAFHLVGLNEWAVRLPSEIAATGLVFASWRFGCWAGGDRRGLLTAIMLATNPFTFALGRTGQHDMLLTCFLSLALYSWFYGFTTQKQWGYLSFFGCLGLAVLAKGPVALAIVGLAGFTFLVWTGNWQVLRAMPWGWGSLIFAIILLPWYGVMLWGNGWTFLSQFLGYNNLDRFLYPNLNQSAPWYLYLALLAVGYFPWNGLWPLAVIQGWPTRIRWPLNQEEQRLTRLRQWMGCWLVGVVVLMSAAATKLPWYVFPALPALAYLCAEVWEAQQDHPKPSTTWQLLGLGGIYGLGAIAVLTLPPRLLPLDLMAIVAATHIPVLWALILGAAAGSFVLSAWYRQVLGGVCAGVFAFMAIAMTCITVLLPVLDLVVLAGQLQPITQTLQRVLQEDCPTAIPAAYRLKDPSLNFYSRLDCIHRVEVPSELERLLHQPRPVVLILKATRLPEVDFPNGGVTPIVTAGEYRLFLLAEAACQKAPE
jgi:4-amino-4-deoxy-L-arabinose transferase-like glycosyltransferase